MALIDKASLLMVPSTYEDGTLYNVLPSGNKAPDETGNHNGYDQTRADFTFDRGNNLAATRIDENGVLQKGRENVLLQSNSFSTSPWGPSAAMTITGNQPDKDGGSSAWLIQRSDNASRYINQNISLGQSVYTYSVYAKAGSVNWLFMWTYDGSGSRTRYFDLQNGVVGSSVDGTIDVDIESVGNGWYRCSITYDDSIVAVRLYPAEDNGTIVGGSTDASLYIQSAQLEKGLVSTPYIETGATTAKAGILEDMPRIDYTSGTGALLLEGLRSNLITQSEYIGSSSFGQGSGTDVLDNQIISPDGSQNAGKVIANTTTNGDHYLNQSPQPSVSSSTAYVFSVFAKKGELQYIQVGSNIQGGAYKQLYVNLNDGSIESSNYTITPTIKDYGNGWYRISVFGTTGSSQTSADVYIVALNDSQSRYYTGNGTDGLYTWGWQLESGNYVSSYIPTYGSAVSRSADSCLDGGSAESINVTEGVLYAEVSAFSGTFRAISLSNNTNSNVVALLYRPTVNEIWMQVRSNGVETNIKIYNVNQLQNNKIAIKYKENDFALWVNGVKEGTNTSGSTPVSLDNIKFTRGDGGEVFTGNVKQVAVFNEALSDAELATLTTL